MVDNNGSGFTDVPVIGYIGDGTGATFVAELAPTSLSSITVVNGGSGYKNTPDPIISDTGGGTGATFNILLTPTIVESISVTNQGSGYTTASVSITGGGGSGCVAFPIIVGGHITAINVFMAGSGYTSNPTITVNGNGTGATAVSILQATTVASVQVLTAGSGYTKVPTFSVQGISGSGALFTANIVPTTLQDIIVTSGGINFTNPPIITITGGGGSGADAFSLISPGKIIDVFVINTGSLYSVANVVITGDGMDGAITLSIEPLAVSAINITDPGSGYTEQPTVIITGQDPNTNPPFIPPVFIDPFTEYAVKIGCPDNDPNNPPPITCCPSSKAISTLSIGEICSQNKLAILPAVTMVNPICIDNFRYDSNSNVQKSFCGFKSFNYDIIAKKFECFSLSFTNFDTQAATLCSKLLTNLTLNLKKYCIDSATFSLDNGDRSIPSCDIDKKVLNVFERIRFSCIGPLSGENIDYENANICSVNFTELNFDGYTKLCNIEDKFDALSFNTQVTFCANHLTPPTVTTFLPNDKCYAIRNFPTYNGNKTQCFSKAFNTVNTYMMLRSLCDANDTFVFFNTTHQCRQILLNLIVYVMTTGGQENWFCPNIYPNNLNTERSCRSNLEIINITTT